MFSYDSYVWYIVMQRDGMDGLIVIITLQLSVQVHDVAAKLSNVEEYLNDDIDEAVILRRPVAKTCDRSEGRSELPSIVSPPTALADVGRFGHIVHKWRPE